MGKRAREKKLSRLEERAAELRQIEERKKSRLAPSLQYFRKFILTLLATIILLWLGVFVMEHISAILERLVGRGS